MAGICVGKKLVFLALMALAIIALAEMRGADAACEPQHLASIVSCLSAIDLNNPLQPNPDLLCCSTLKTQKDCACKVVPLLKNVVDVFHLKNLLAPVCDLGVVECD